MGFMQISKLTGGPNSPTDQSYGTCLGHNNYNSNMCGQFHENYLRDNEVIELLLHIWISTLSKLTRAVGMTACSSTFVIVTENKSKV